MAAVVLTSPRGGTTTVESLGDLENYMRRGFTAQPGNTTEEYRRVLTGQATALQVPATITAGATVFIDGVLAAPGTTVTRDVVQVQRWVRDRIATVSEGAASLPVRLAWVDDTDSVFRTRLVVPTGGRTQLFPVFGWEQLELSAAPILQLNDVGFIRATRPTSRRMSLHLLAVGPTSGTTTLTFDVTGTTATLTAPAAAASGTSFARLDLFEESRIDLRWSSTAPAGTTVDAFLIATEGS